MTNPEPAGESGEDEMEWDEQDQDDLDDMPSAFPEDDEE
jgi:hypothetical protein